MHVPGQTTIGDLSEIASKLFDLDQFVVDRLEFSCQFHATAGNPKRLALMETDVTDDAEMIDNNGERKQLMAAMVNSNVVTCKGGTWWRRTQPATPSLCWKSCRKWLQKCDKLTIGCQKMKRFVLEWTMQTDMEQ